MAENWKLCNNLFPADIDWLTHANLAKTRRPGPMNMVHTNIWVSHRSHRSHEAHLLLLVLTIRDVNIRQADKLRALLAMQPL